MEIVVLIIAAYLAVGLVLGLLMLRECGWGAGARTTFEALLVATVAWPAILIAAKSVSEDDQ